MGFSPFHYRSAGLHGVKSSPQASVLPPSVTLFLLSPLLVSPHTFVYFYAIYVLFSPLCIRQLQMILPKKHSMRCRQRSYATAAEKTSSKELPPAARGTHPGTHPTLTTAPGK